MHYKTISFLYLAVFAFCGNVYAKPPLYLTLRKGRKEDSLIKQGAQVITSKAIKDSSAQKISEVLEAGAGIQLQDQSGDGSRTIISMRGFGDNASSNSLILLNGVPMINPSLSPPLFNLLPISEIDRIEILPSSAGVLYGDQAVGGIVNIITRSPQKNYKAVSVSIGSYETQKYQAVFSNKLKNGLGYRIAAQHMQSDNYRDHNDSLQNSAWASFDYPFDHNSEFNFQYFGINQHLELPGPKINKDRRRAKNKIDFDNRQYHILNFGFKKEWTNGCFRLDALLKKVRGRGENTRNMARFLFHEDGDSQFLRPSIKQPLNLFNRVLLLHAGIDYSHGSYDYTSAGYNTNAGQTQYAGYLQLTIPIIKSLDFVLGGRTADAHNTLSSKIGAIKNSQSGTDDAAISEESLRFHLSGASEIFITRAGNYRFPKTDENAQSKNGKLLKTQTGVSYEIGWMTHYYPYQLSASIYQLNLKNEILYVPDLNGSLFGGKNENLPPTQRRGFIFGGSYFIRPNWEIELHYNFVHAVLNSGNNSGKVVPFVSSHTLRLSSRYGFNEHWKLFGEGIYISPRYPAADIANRAEKLGGYAVFNLGVLYEYKPFLVSLRINNITNKYYNAYATAVYRSAGDTNVSYYPAPDRNILLTVSVDV